MPPAVSYFIELSGRNLPPIQEQAYLLPPFPLSPRERLSSEITLWLGDHTQKRDASPSLEWRGNRDCLKCLFWEDNNANQCFLKEGSLFGLQVLIWLVTSASWWGRCIAPSSKHGSRNRKLTVVSWTSSMKRREQLETVPVFTLTHSLPPVT